MKKNLKDSWIGSAPYIPQTLDEEALHFRMGEDATFPSEAKEKEKKPEPAKKRSWKSKIFAPVASVVAVATVVTAATGVAPIGDISLHFEPDPIELYAGISCEGVDRGVLYEGGAEFPCELRYESLTEGLEIMEERFFDHRDEEQMPEFGSPEEEEAWFESHSKTYWMFYPLYPLENAEVRVTCEALGFEQTVRLNAYELRILFDDGIEKTLEDRAGIGMEVGGTVDLDARLNYDLPLYNPQDKQIRYYSSDPYVLSVDENGNVTAQGEGIAEIHAYCMSAQRSVTVYVGTEPPEAKKEFTLSGDSLTEIYTNDSLPLDCALLDKDGVQIDASLTYESLTPDLLYVNGSSRRLEAGSQPGTGVLRVICDDPKAVFEIGVQVVEPRISLGGQTETTVGSSFSFDARLEPLLRYYYDVPLTFEYVSGDPDVLEVSSDGWATAKSEGTAVITVKCAAPQAETSVEVTVRPFDVPPHTHAYEWRYDTDGHRQICTICNEETAKEPHTGGSATCVSPAVCTVCGAEYGDVDPDNHTGQTELRNRKDPTETEDGYSGDLYCLDCGGMIEAGSVIPSTGHVHTLLMTSAVEPTHFEEGNIDYYYCTSCSKYFSDENASIEITYEETVLDVIPHEFVTAYDETGHWQECSCGTVEGKEEHELSYTYGENEHRRVCACGYAEEDAPHDFKIVFDQTTHRSECVCGLVRDRDNHYGGAATCVSAAVCEFCGSAYGEVDPSNHAGDFEVRNARAASEDAEGYTGDTYCLACGKLAYGGAVIPRTAHVHNLSYTAAKEATHYEQGNIAYYRCSGCGSYFTDRAATDQITKDQTVLPVIPHTYVRRYDASNHWRECSCGSVVETEAHGYSAWSVTTAPTCTVSGARERACGVCSFIQTGVVAPTGHSYGTPTYAWSSDNATCTATSVCANDASHRQTETVRATSSVTTPATCTAAGTTAFTASFVNKLFTAQTKTASVAAIGHNYGTPTYTWSGTRSCTATAVCANDASHTLSETATATNAVTTPATCTAAGVRTYTAAFANAAFTAQTKTASISALGHNYSATTAVCTRCGDKLADVTMSKISDDTGEPGDATAISPDNASSPIKVLRGSSYNLNVTLKSGAAVSDESSPWSAESPAGATASVLAVRSSSGTSAHVYAVTEGSADVTLTFTYGGTTYKLRFSFTVTEPPYISLLDKEVILYTGDKKNAPVALVNSDATLTYASSDRSVMTVNSGGVLTAVAPGEARLTVRSVADGLETSIGVIVREPPWDAAAPEFSDASPHGYDDSRMGSTVRYSNGNDVVEITCDENGTWQKTVYGADSVDLSYDASSNTLTFSGLEGGYLSVTAMGGSFTLKPVGQNALDSIFVNGAGHSSGLTITGSGSLTVNGNMTEMYGIEMVDYMSNGDPHEACLILSDQITLTVYGGSSATYSGAAILVRNTSFDKGIYMLSRVVLNYGTVGLYSDDGTYTVLDASGAAAKDVYFYPA